MPRHVKMGEVHESATEQVFQVEGDSLTALSFCFSFLGFVADATGSYKPAFWLAGSFCIAAAASISLGSLCMKTPQQSEKPREAESDALVVTEKLSVV